jgi:hypothetical protein
MEYQTDRAAVEVNYYLKRRFTDPYDKERGAHPFYLKTHHSFYEKFSKFWNPSTTKFLEFGGGPVIYPLISAAPFVNEITFADYQQSNIDAVIAWKHRREGHYNWDPYFKYVLAELEQNDSDEAVLKRQEEVRRKCTSILIGDIHAKDILSRSEKSDEQFDIVSCNFCCEVAAETVEEYHANVQRLSKLVKPGGFLLSLASLEESYWYTSYSNERKFHLSIVEDDVKKAFIEAGFDIVYTDIHNLPESARHIIGDTKANYFIVGQK